MLAQVFRRRETLIDEFLKRSSQDETPSSPGWDIPPPVARFVFPDVPDSRNPAPAFAVRLNGGVAARRDGEFAR